jgi:hypothetical protein
LEDFGPFTESADSAMDPFASPFDTKFEDDSAFDFGEFQTSDKDGETTPTAGSWQWESADKDAYGADVDFAMENAQNSASHVSATGSRRSHRREASRS